jgi:L-ribulose-5-phosphate 3-epimerase
MTLGAPLAGHTMCYCPYSLEEALNGIAEAGFRGVELTAIPGVAEHVHFDSRPRDVMRICDAFGLEAISVSAHANLTTAEGLEHTVKAVHWAGECGIGIVNGAIGGSWTDAAGEAAFMRNVGRLAGAARSAGVVVALEIDGPTMGSGEISRPLIERIALAEIQVNYDTANCEFAAGVRAVDDLATILPYVAHVHLKDTMGGKDVWDFPALGDGVVDFDRVLEILEESGYTGPIVVEIEFQGEPWPSLGDVNDAVGRSYRYLVERGLA